MAAQTSRKEINADAPIFTLPPYKVERVVVAASEVLDWGLEMFSIPTFWRQTKGQGIKVAVLDTGIDFQHPDLESAIADSKDFTGSRSGAYDIQGHGTHVAGTIAARQDSRGVVGVAPLAELLIGKVLGDSGFGSARSIADGIRWAVKEEADIISMSLGSPFYNKEIHEAVQDAVKAGVFIICAAGNDGPKLDSVNYPGALDETVAVGSIDRRKKISRFSSIGKQVDVVAPGDEIFSTYPPKDYAVLSGTSMATPFVSGVVALVLSKHREFGGNTPITNQTELMEHLRKTAMDLGPTGFDPRYGFGLINPEELLVSESQKMLNFLAREDLTDSGRQKIQEFLGGAVKATARGEAYLEGSLRDGLGEISGGVKITF